jgi:mannose-1-phosphate guanylyltransferase
MAGGVGTRFWPMSRQQRPKQFLDILGTGRTLLQQTYDRFKKIMPEENILIVTNKGYKSLVYEQLPGISENQVLLEPSRRNTAPCIAYALSKIGSKNPGANVVVAPSDHLILKEEAFLDQVMKGFNFSEANPAIVTLGIRPSRPDTGYGYIQYIHEDAGSEVCKVKTFTEKPNAELAKSFLSSGEFLWNSGLFITTTKVMLHAFQKYLPDMYHVFQDGAANYFTEKEEAFLELAYAQCTNISIDYGIIEKADNVYVIPSEFGWSDLGTWGSLYENSSRDANQNAVVGRKSMLYDTKNCIVNVPKEKLVVVQGLDGYIVVESDGILLICKKDNEQEIRQMVSNVKVQRGEEYI